jgi:ABC-type transporter Mla MlaB component
MVRITTETYKDRIVWRVEGSLRGPWVTELEKVWQSACHCDKRLCLNLEDVSYVDDAAMELLIRMFQDGIELVASGPYMTAIVEEIRSGCFSAPSVADFTE